MEPPKAKKKKPTGSTDEVVRPDRMEKDIQSFFHKKIHDEFNFLVEYSLKLNYYYHYYYYHQFYTIYQTG